MIKKKAFLLAGAMSILLGGFGVGTAALMADKPQAFDATGGTGHTWGIIGSFSSNNWVSDVATSHYVSETNSDVVSYFLSAGTAFKIRADSAWTVALTYSELSQERTGNTAGWFTADSDGNAVVASGFAGTYSFSLINGIYTYGDKSYGITTTFTPAATYSISEFAVVDGVKESAPFKTEAAVEQANFSPVDTHRTGMAFGGWFTDEACLNSYSETVWTAAGSLYAKYTSCEATSYFYFNVQGIDNLYVYTFGQSEAMGFFPGTKVTSMTNGVNFLSVGGIAKIPYFSDSGDDKVVLSDGSGTYVVGTNKTNDFVLSTGNFYTMDAATSFSGDADKGAAAKVVYDINTARCAVAAGSGFLAGSVCGVSKALATVLVNEYSALSGDALTPGTQKYYAATATDYVYDYQNTSTNVNVNIGNIVAQLNLIALGSSLGGARIGLGLNENDGSTFTFFVLVGAGCLAAVAIYFFLKKKKVSLA